MDITLQASKEIIKIESNVLSCIYSNIQNQKNKPESGGMLIGSIIKNTGAIIIEDCTSPIDSDRRDRFFYFRSINHNKTLHGLWRKSGKTKMYLGEWHTHPTAHPTPSYQDINNWKALLNNCKTDSRILVFIILGTESIGFWIGHINANEIIKIGEVNHAK